MSKELILNRQRGVGLIEVLVAVLVLSIGLLGMAALQSRSVADNNSAMARSMAVIASYSMFDAMRADESGVESGAYDGASCENLPSSAFANANVQNWCDTQLSPLGDSVTGEIEEIGSDSRTYEISISFSDEQGQGADGTNRQTTIVTRSKL